MKLSKIALIATLMAASASITTAYGQEQARDYRGKHAHRMHMAHYGEAPLARIVQKLDLTDEQRQSLRALLESSKAQRQNLHEQQRANASAALTTLPDDPGYFAMIEKRKQLAAESIQQRSDLNVQIYALLTPEQKAQVPALIEEMKSKAGDRRNIMRKRRFAQ
ncbi:MAG: hypothetical protein GX535_05545 [Xanthomonadaceae bacterium]|nr:hypothetical protein [Xanthomonadaceae bacterium]